MIDRGLIGQYVLLFLADGVAGYFLQFVGYALAIHAFNKRRIITGSFFSMAIIFAIFSFMIRNTPYIKFGCHTILTAIICVIISCKVFKTEIYPTVLAVLLTIVSILFFEMLTFVIFTTILGSEDFSKFFVGIKTTAESISRALLGVPTNILLVIEMFIVYKYYLKKVKNDDLNGAADKENSR